MFSLVISCRIKGGGVNKNWGGRLGTSAFYNATLLVPDKYKNRNNRND